MSKGDAAILGGLMLFVAGAIVWALATIPHDTTELDTLNARIDSLQAAAACSLSVNWPRPASNKQQRENAINFMAVTSGPRDATLELVIRIQQLEARIDSLEQEITK